MAEKEIMQPTESIVELFHKVASLIPEGQVPISANPNMKIVEAISLMEKYDFSQLPVVSGKFVIGIFSDS